MSYMGIVEIETSDADVYVNAKLAANEGWELLSITPTPEGPVYTIGRRKADKDQLGEFGSQVTG